MFFNLFKNIKLRKVEKIVLGNNKMGIYNFSKKAQCEMLFNHDFTPFIRTKKCEKYSEELLDFYIDLSIEEMVDYLMQIDYFKIRITDIDDRRDGFKIIVNSDETYSFIDEEHGNMFINEKFSSKEKLLEFVAKIILSKVHKYAHLFDRVKYSKILNK
jgi:hypothetical protein